MEIALYWPDGGYYTTCLASADYYTAPAAHPAFGALICLQLYQMWSLLGEPRPFWVVEPGAGNGQLGRDITSFASQLSPIFGHAMRYICLERHPRNENELQGIRESRQEWLAALGLPFHGIAGVVLSNELLDAFPVHRVRMEQGRLHELYVALEGDHLVERVDPPSMPALEHRLQCVGVTLEEGWEAEINLAVDDWMTQASDCLERGFVLTIDYGRDAAGLYSAERKRGTLTTFRNHVQTDSPLRDVGRQDITTQVDFTAVELAGDSVGLESWGRISQRQFLLNMGLRTWLTSLSGTMGEAETNANRMGMQRLVQPGGMGDFQVMLQAKGVGPTDLWALSSTEAPEMEALFNRLAPPRLTPRHTDLLGASYPHLAQTYDRLWPGVDAV